MTEAQITSPYQNSQNKGGNPYGRMNASVAKFVMFVFCFTCFRLRFAIFI